MSANAVGLAFEFYIVSVTVRYIGDQWIPSQRTLTMFVGVVALHYLC